MVEYPHLIEMLQRLLLTYVPDLLLFVETYQADGTSFDAYRVPTDETVAEVCPQASHQSGNDDPQATSHIKHIDPSRDISIIVNILLMICTNHGDSTQMRSNPTKPDFEWVIDCLTRTWQILEPTNEQIISQASKRTCYSPFLNALRVCLPSSRLVKRDTLESVQAAALLCQSISCILHYSFEDLSSDLQNTICWSVNELLSLGNKFPLVLQVYNEYLGFSLQAIDEPCSRMELYGDDLQVSTYQSIFSTL